jgi:predicted negative regulator of RcsB-dependent stress response
MWVLKAGVVLAFVALIAAIALVVWRDYMKNKRAAED